tara:strand:+ start:6097 stop:6852 length:756 start_codon:yes stop_codon:yes gene_type:complete
MLDFLTRDLCALDVETTGLNSETDRIVQLGVYILSPDGSIKDGVQLFNPQMKIPIEASNIHGITDEIIKDEPTFDKIAPSIVNGFKDCDLCGYNIDFDLRFLRAELKRCGLELSHEIIIDAQKIFKRFTPHTLVSARARYLHETDMANAHDALVDAKSTLNVFVAQVKVHHLPHSIEEIHRMVNMPTPGFLDSQRKFKWINGQACINFGKFRDHPIKSVERDYLEWILKSDFTDEVKAITQDALNGKFPVQ